MASKSPDMSYALRLRCTRLVYEVAMRYRLPPVYVTAHVRFAGAAEARREVMVRMIAELGMRRWQVAHAFGCDLRRVRASVLAATKQRIYSEVAP